MTSNNQVQIVKDLPNKKIIVTRDFEASVEEVWKAWTESELLEQWWAPQPWKAATKYLDFKEGGYWLYAMVGPDNTKHWSRIDYQKIERYKSFEAMDSFCDEEGTINKDFPIMHWHNKFDANKPGTIVTVEISFTSADDFEKLLGMGFEAGFTAALSNLENYFRTHADPV